MGSVSVDLHKKERDFNNLNLSDKDVVKYLILYRSKVDLAYGASTNIDINQAGSLYDFNQEVIALYASLDKLVEKCGLTTKQKRILEMFYKGNTISDVVEITGADRVSTYQLLDRIVGKVVNENNEDWYYMTGHNGNILT